MAFLLPTPLLLLVLPRSLVVGEVLLLTGGYSPRGDLSSVEVVGEEECGVQPLPLPRSGHSSFLSGGQLLTCGGTRGGTPLHSGTGQPPTWGLDQRVSPL